MSKYSLIVFLNFILFETCRSSGKLSITLSKYNNTGGKLADGSGCDWDISVISDKECDHNFEVCVDQPNGSLTDMGQCSIGKYKTEDVANRNQIHFIQGTIHENPKILPFNIWQGGFTLKVQVWDKDKASRDDLVELLSKHISIKAAMSRNKSVAKSFELKNRTQLTVQVGVFCDDNWYGPRCDCQPSSNASGHYYCHSTTGVKICSTHWYGPNCTVNCWLVNGTRQGYDCGPDGRKICLKHWYGPECNIFCRPSRDENGHYECATNGSKVCKPGWTGQNCTKNFNECKSSPCSSPGGQCVDKINKYICECQPGYTGQTCETKTSTEGSKDDEKTKGLLIPVIAAVSIVIIIAVVIAVIVWKMRQKKKKQGNRHNMENGQEQNDIALYDNPEAVNTQHVADDNIYYNVAGGPQNNNRNDTQVYEDPGTAATGDVYAVPDKRKLNRDPSKRNSTTSINSEVVLEDNEIYN